MGSLVGASLGRTAGSDKPAVAEHLYLPTAQSHPAKQHMCYLAVTAMFALSRTCTLKSDSSDDFLLLLRGSSELVIMMQSTRIELNIAWACHQTGTPKGGVARMSC